MAATTAPWWHPRTLLREENAGLLLDLTVLLANLLVMDAAARLFVLAVQRSDGGNRTAMAVLGVFTIALFVLQPLGAFLKRWHFHQRIGDNRSKAVAEGGGCLFHPAFYLSLQFVVFFSAAALLSEAAGVDTRDSAAVFLSILFGGIGLVLVNTFFVYRYFSPPARPPRIGWLAAPRAERFGDLCLFANMLCFQVLWNIVGQMEISRVDGVGEFIGRLGLMLFLALLLYFPPRMLYLVEDIHRPRVWLSMALANAPVIWRVVIGTGA